MVLNQHSNQPNRIQNHHLCHHTTYTGYPQGDGMVAPRRSLWIRSQPSRQWRPWGSPCLWSEVVMIVIQCPFLGCLPQDLKIIFETQIPDNFNSIQVHSGVARLVALNPNVKVPASETSLHPREVAPWSGCHSGFPPRQSISFHPLIDPSIYQSINTWIHPIHEIAPWVRMPYRFSIHYTPSTFDIRKTTTFIKLTKQIRRNARLNLNQELLPSPPPAGPGELP